MRNLFDAFKVTMAFYMLIAPVILIGLVLIILMEVFGI